MGRTAIRAEAAVAGEFDARAVGTAETAAARNNSLGVVGTVDCNAKQSQSVDCSHRECAAAFATDALDAVLGHWFLRCGAD